MFFPGFFLLILLLKGKNLTVENKIILQILGFNGIFWILFFSIISFIPFFWMEVKSFMASFFGDAFISDAMNIISQSLTVPVLIILLIIVVISLFLLGEVIAEYFRNRKNKGGNIYDLIFQISNASSVENLKEIISDSPIPDMQKMILTKIADTKSLKKSSREAAARRLVETEEEKINKTLDKTDVITRVGPTLGLMGTLIPMGPGLAALGAGDINTLATSLTLAFNTTIVGIGSGALCYFLGKIRNQWYDKYLADLDALSDAVLDYME